MSHSQQYSYRAFLLASVVLPVSIGLSGEASLRPDKEGVPNLPSILHLTDGSFVTGTLQDSDKPGILRWQCPAFLKSFDFTTQSISTIHYPAKDDPQKPRGATCFELAGGDLLFGSLIGFSGDQAELDLKHFGKVHVRREYLRRFQKWNDETDLIFHGPNGLLGWEKGEENGWEIDAGHLMSKKQGAAIFGDFGLPARTCIELELSWSRRPDFIVELGVEEKKSKSNGLFRFEVWDKDLIVMGETESDAMIASLAQISSDAGRVALRAYLDQEQHRLAVFSSDGKRV